MMGFHVGQLVVCVDGHCPTAALGEETPRKGSVYTVRNLFHDAIRLVEIVNKPPPYNTSESAFYLWRFRPLDESRIAIFREMLVTPPPDELVADHLDASIADCERAVREALGF